MGKETPPCISGDKPHHMMLISPLNGKPPEQRCSSCRLSLAQIRSMNIHVTLTHLVAAVLMLLDDADEQGAMQALHGAAERSQHLFSSRGPDHD